MFVTLTCPNCNHGIEGVLYPLFGDMEADCPACGLHVEVPEDRLESLVFSALTADQPPPSGDDGAATTGTTA